MNKSILNMNMLNVLKCDKQQTFKFVLTQARKKKRGRGYKPHTGPVRSSDKLDKLTEPLEKTEMKMMKDEYDQYTTAVTEGSPDPLMQQMPTSCQSILKVMHLFKVSVLFSFFFLFFLIFFYFSSSFLSLYATL